MSMEWELSWEDMRNDAAVTFSADFCDNVCLCAVFSFYWVYSVIKWNCSIEEEADILLALLVCGVFVLVHCSPGGGRDN